MKKAELIRKGRVIYYANGNASSERTVFEQFPSISKAKRRSREWQQANGGLGIGALRVER